MLSSFLPCLFVFLPIESAYSLAVNTSSVLYAPVTSSLSAASISESPGACKDLDTCRSLYSIVQTCLATIFACVWVAVHRNIPAPRSKPEYSSNVAVKTAQWLWSKILNQKQSAIVFTVTLLAPEWILAWAVRQALRAQQLAGELEDARAHAKGRWEEGQSSLSQERGGKTAEENGNRSTGVSLQTSPDDKQPLIGKRSELSSKGTFHPEDEIECTSRIA